MTLQTSRTLRDYIRVERLPTTWCPGCGLGIIMNCIVQAVDHRGLGKDEVAMISGIGCTGRMSGYVDFNTIHTTHGRAPAFATGVKMARPDMTVLTVMGDGDAMSIGGNHLAHAMRRNIGIVAVVVNNHVYGLTGGQSSPTTPTGSVSTTTTAGSIERPMDLEAVARTMRAPFFARATVNHTSALVKLIERAIEVNCFALVEVISNCHTIYGRMNGTPEAADMIAAMEGDTRPTNPTLERRRLLPVRVTSSGIDVGAHIVNGGHARTEPLLGRGVIWDRTGADDLSHRYRDWAEQGK